MPTKLLSPASSSNSYAPSLRYDFVTSSLRNCPKTSKKKKKSTFPFTTGIYILFLQNAVGVSLDNHPIPTLVPLFGIVPFNNITHYSYIMLRIHHPIPTFVTSSLRNCPKTHFGTIPEYFIRIIFGINWSTFSCIFIKHLLIVTSLTPQTRRTSVFDTG
jgi:hypothetical protein